ncbi:class I SAM-dependent methyltransferase [Chitinophaga sp. B61]|uniref:Class I SAM-dependent methyltransferase n=2 Tax=Chitinophaga rhizophila TaxID=2866212 RepID=A0ABS7GHL8_9BACT|nr:class I SAM-dependent methyltransferase [Chitinophaga rhizophila]MBW8687191.1 class I SAM-dependent methyltransferase [Chitinophaga rhizophila]
MKSAFYDLAAFKAGKTSLNEIELEELGDVSGKKLLHLQCHFGMDTISWAKRGAETTGLDFSDKAIDAAKELAVEMGVNSQFVCSNVYDAGQHLSEKFDIVFTSYGTIGWLPDLNRWAAVIAERLKPGGVFYMVDFHPVVWMFDDTFSYFKYSYFNTGLPIEEENSGTYADRDADLRDKEYGWNHSLSDILNALIKAGLNIRLFNEHATSPYECFSNMVQTGPSSYQIAKMEDKLPMLYSIKAVYEK